MNLARSLAFTLMAVLLPSCAQFDNRHVMHISVADQKMLVTDDGEPVATYPVSTSKFGLSTAPGSYGTPLGKHRVVKKIGDGLPSGAVFKSRRFTGEVLPVDAPGRDPIVTRILWLDGREARNGNSYERFIYIHGTPEERNIGLPTSYGCVRMRSRDVIALYDRVGLGARVDIFTEPLSARFPHLAPPAPAPAAVPAPGAEPSMASVHSGTRDL
jgi:lipoprotein-anchoring transpeptidase ErfK/SrfK